jgi:PKD repeat protein
MSYSPMKKLLLISCLLVGFYSASAQICTAVITHVINGNQVQYFGSSPDNPSSWSWFFNGGSPMTSSQQNPTVTYANPGTYICALTISGGPNNCSASLSSKQDTVTIVSTGLNESNSGQFSMDLVAQSPIRFSLSNDKTQQVKVQLFDLNGRLVETVFEGMLYSGKNMLEMKTFNIPSGNYLLSIYKEGGVISKKFYLQ